MPRTSRTWLRALKFVALVACVAMAAATVSEVLAWALVNAGNPTRFLGAMLLGAMPLLVAVLIVVAMRGIGKPAEHGTSVRFLRLIAGVGFVPIVVGGFLTAFGASTAVSPESPAFKAFDVWQYTFVAAVIGDVAVFMMAMLTPTQIGQGGISG